MHFYIYTKKTIKAYNKMSNNIAVDPETPVIPSKAKYLCSA